MRKALILAAALTACATLDPPAPLPGAPFAAELAAFAAADQEAMPGTCQTLFVGSSSIRLWTTLAEDMAPRVAINRGFGGSTIADVNLHFDDVVARYRPRAIVFYAGENDIDMGVEPEAVVAAFRDFMALKRRALGKTPVYFISLKPSRLRMAQMSDQAEVNGAIATIARRARDLEFIDVAPEMLENGAPRDLYVADGLHMNAAGYAIWTRLVNEALTRMPPRRAPGCN